ncbi:protein-L-isoaspartate(D-aspartate) O-methyltransferase [Silvimonas soli]|uniref:protein-L-isoaspartate(D-aspartate) O-methyltransferase n=2 Tax=Silvimonas TaxID=300264 RepID=UPI0024B35CC8|nr:MULTISPECIES: protein-L-isoaspartate(D-aspartate) O-methyltransferase [Silvimonas]MDR3428701.1 protein-L-isoaspartate(D-aspartate) O-methyltransferase [Silvimonas sp.]
MNFSNVPGMGMTSARTRTRMIERLKSQGIVSSEVLGIMGEVPRHAFVDEAISHKAYDDMSLPIGHGQTISQPYIVARMTELAIGVAQRERVLEIGTGCGYQTTVLAQFFKTVYSIERIGGLAKQARERLSTLGVLNTRLRHGDGSRGLPDGAPYDVIMLTAAAPVVPEALIAQLKPGGRMIFPVGGEIQELRMIELTTDGPVEQRLEKVRFVPLLPGMA